MSTHHVDAVWRTATHLLVRLGLGHFVVLDATGAIVERYDSGSDSVGLYYTSYYVVGDQLLTTFSIPEASDTGEYDPSVVLDGLVPAADADTRRFVEAALGDADRVERA